MEMHPWLRFVLIIVIFELLSYIVSVYALKRTWDWRKDFFQSWGISLIIVFAYLNFFVWQ